MPITPLTSELLSQYHVSYLNTLATLSPVGNHDITSILDCFDRMSMQGTRIFVALDEQNNKVVGTISVLIEHKCNRGGSRVAHLEDLAVHPDAQNQGIGKQLIQTAIRYAKELHCYKIILDTDKDPAHVSYYEQFGFTTAGAYMRMNI